MFMLTQTAPGKVFYSTTLFFGLIVGLLIFPVPSFSADPSYELGLNFNLLLPTHLPEFNTSIPGVGPSLWIPVGGDQLRVQALFSAANNVTFLYLIETGYYWKLPTPFFTCFFDLGLHYLHYEGPDAFNFLGVNGGFGFSIMMTKGFDIILEGKGYLQQKPMVTFGGGFAFLL
jgi:hypothetical protein